MDREIDIFHVQGVRIRPEIRIEEPRVFLSGIPEISFFSYMTWHSGIGEA
jgi:hypothetical protein